MTTRTSIKNTLVSTASTDKRMKRVKCTDYPKEWSSATACAEDLGVSLKMVYGALNGKYKTVKGIHICYEEDVAGMYNGMTDGLARANAKAEALNAKNESLSAEKDALKAENNSMRAELERLRALEKQYNKEQAVKTAHKEAIAKAEKRLERRQRIYDKDKARADYSLERLLNAQQELDDLKNGRK